MIVPTLAAALSLGVPADITEKAPPAPTAPVTRPAKKSPSNPFPDSLIPEDERMLMAFEGRRSSTALKLAQELLQNKNTGVRARTSAQLVEVFSLIRLRRGQEALAALKRLHLNGPPMGPYLSSLSAQAMATSRDCAGAEEATLGMPESSVFRAGSWYRVGSCWLRAKNAERVLQAADRMAKEAGPSWERANAEILRARGHELAGDRRDARDAYRTILLEYSTSNAARTAKAALDRYEARGIKVPGFSAQELLKRADRERGSQRVTVATSLYNQVKNLATKPKDSALKYSAELGLIEVDMVNRAYRKAQRRVETVMRRAKAPSVKARAHFLHGDVLSRRGHVTTALASYDKLLRELPNEPFAIESAIAAMKLAYGAERFDVAATYARWILEHPASRQGGTVVGDDGVHRNPQDAGRAVDHALWYLAWIERRMGAAKETVDGLLARIDPKGPIAPDALYWRARLAYETGEPHAARVFVHWLFEQAPTSFQALAAMDLVCGQKPEHEKANCEEGLGMPSFVDDPPSVTARPGFAPSDLLGPTMLFEFGLIGPARDALRTIDATQLTHADRVSAAWLYRRSGDLHRGALVARRAVVGDKSEVQDPVLLEVAYPRPYNDIVRKESARYGVPEDLIYAVMREESAFNPRAVSPRLARGLMQMIRPTARRLAREAQLKRFRLRQLYQPEISIRLGTHYLSFLLQEFDGNIVAAVASYHAGERAVGRWLKSKGHLPPDEFIVDIPYTSTRGYVKKVLGSYGVYRLLYQPSPNQAIGLASGGKLPLGVSVAQAN